MFVLCLDWYAMIVFLILYFTCKTMTICTHNTNPIFKMRWIIYEIIDNLTQWGFFFIEEIKKLKYKENYRNTFNMKPQDVVRFHSKITSLHSIVYFEK